MFCCRLMRHFAQAQRHHPGAFGLIVQCACNRTQPHVAMKIQKRAVKHVIAIRPHVQIVGIQPGLHGLNGLFQRPQFVSRRLAQSQLGRRMRL